MIAREGQSEKKILDYFQKLIDNQIQINDLKIRLKQYHVDEYLLFYQIRFFDHYRSLSPESQEQFLLFLHETHDMALFENHTIQKNHLIEFLDHHSLNYQNIDPMIKFYQDFSKSGMHSQNFRFFLDVRSEGKLKNPQEVLRLVALIFQKEAQIFQMCKSSQIWKLSPVIFFSVFNQIDLGKQGYFQIDQLHVYLMKKIPISELEFYYLSQRILHIVPNQNIQNIVFQSFMSILTLQKYIPPQQSITFQQQLAILKEQAEIFFNHIDPCMQLEEERYKYQQYYEQTYEQTYEQNYKQNYEELEYYETNKDQQKFMMDTPRSLIHSKRTHQKTTSLNFNSNGLQRSMDRTLKLSIFEKSQMQASFNFQARMDSDISEDVQVNQLPQKVQKYSPIKLVQKDENLLVKHYNVQLQD